MGFNPMSCEQFDEESGLLLPSFPRRREGFSASSRTTLDARFHGHDDSLRGHLDWQWKKY
jgi:hypothetical protein